MLPDVEIKELVDIFHANDPGRVADTVGKVVASLDAPGHGLVPLQMMILARSLYGDDFAVAIADRFIDVPSLRSLLLWECGTYLGRGNQAARAIEYLAPGMREGLFDADQNLFIAMQYARLGKKAVADDILTRIREAHPEAIGNVLAHEQFFGYLQRFGRDQALDRYSALASKFKPQGLNELEDEIARALDEKRPYLLLRLGDGEGSCAVVDEEDTRQYSNLYLSNRQEFCDI